MLRYTYLVLLAAGVGLAGQSRPQFTFQANSRLVVEAVTVAGKAGKPLAGLTAKDFTITEDGVPQTVAFCNFQKILAGKEAQGGAAAPGGASNGSATAANRRLLVLYFDLTTMSPVELYRAVAAARNFIAQRAGPADLIALYTFAGNGVKIRQNFTANREALAKTLDAIEARAAGLAGGGEGMSLAMAEATYGSAFGQDAGEFNLFNNDRELAALETTVEGLAKLRQKKSLVYFNAGMSMNGVDNEAQLQATVQAALGAGVQFFPIDTRGLVAGPPLGDASQAAPGGAGMYNGQAALARAQSEFQRRNALYALAGDTGGKAEFDSNDLVAGMVRAEQAITDYYILGYYTTHDASDGKYHRIRIALRLPHGGKLAYRQGYYAPKAFARFSKANKERQLEEAMMLGNPITELRLALGTSYFQLNSAEYYVPIAVKIPGAELALAQHSGHTSTHLDFIGEVKDSIGMTVTNFRDHMDVNLTGGNAALLAAHPMEYIAGVTLLPGTYSVKFLARDAETGRIGTFLTTLEVPNLNLVATALPISGVVLGSQRVAAGAALYDAAGQKELAASPLVKNGRELLPGITRVFHRPQPLFVYLEAYERGDGAMQPLVVYPAFYQDGRQVLAAPAYVARAGMEPHSRAVLLRFALRLASLAPGNYILQLTIVEPGADKAAFWRGRVSIIP